MVGLMHGWVVIVVASGRISHAGSYPRFKYGYRVN